MHHRSAAVPSRSKWYSRTKKMKNLGTDTFRHFWFTPNGVSGILSENAPLIYILLENNVQIEISATSFVPRDERKISAETITENTWCLFLAIRHLVFAFPNNVLAFRWNGQIERRAGESEATRRCVAPLVKLKFINFNSCCFFHVSTHFFAVASFFFSSLFFSFLPLLTWWRRIHYKLMMIITLLRIYRVLKVLQYLLLSLFIHFVSRLRRILIRNA